MDRYSSGRKGPVTWHLSKDNVAKTKAALVQIAKDFYVNPTYRNTVTSIQLLNEPAGFVGGTMMDVVRDFYYDGYGAMRWPFGTSEQSTWLIRYGGAASGSGSPWSAFPEI